MNTAINKIKLQAMKLLSLLQDDPKAQNVITIIHQPVSTYKSLRPNPTYNEME